MIPIKISSCTGCQNSERDRSLLLHCRGCSNAKQHACSLVEYCGEFFRSRSNNIGVRKANKLWNFCGPALLRCGVPNTYKHALPDVWIRAQFSRSRSNSIGEWRRSAGKLGPSPSFPLSSLLKVVASTWISRLPMTSY